MAEDLRLVKPCTRSTLFRLVLAVHLFDVGLIWAGRYALPRKYKMYYLDPMVAWAMRKFVPIMLETLKNSLVYARMANREYDTVFAGKIGDTIAVRRPGRFAC